MQKLVGPEQVSESDLYRRVEGMTREHLGVHKQILLQVLRFQFLGVDPEFLCSAFQLVTLPASDNLHLQWIAADCVDSVVHMHHMCQFPQPAPAGVGAAVAADPIPLCSFFDTKNRVGTRHNDRNKSLHFESILESFGSVD
jgi:hypothetical protein